MRPSLMAKQLGKNKATIYRELGRNISSQGYQPRRAQENYMDRRQKPSLLASDAALRSSVITLLHSHYSPWQISVTLEKNKDRKAISPESIYQFVYSEMGHDLGLPDYLPRRRKRRKTRVKNKQKKSPIPNRNTIHNRAEVIDERKEFGHWEGDLMIFSNTKSNLITLRERISRLMLVIKNPSKHAVVTANNIIDKFPGKARELLDSLTLDNGGEFASHEMIASQLSLSTFFCDPYSSWQKGGIEQGNGVVRIELPRSIDLDKISQAQINKMMRNINNRPMRLHDNNDSPANVFRQYAGSNLKGFVALQT